jgi:phospholipase C
MKSTALALALSFALPAAAFAATPRHDHQPTQTDPSARVIKHVIVIFGENISFDHYFGTYPFALNPKGEPAFYPAAGTRLPNNLDGLLTHNPNRNPANGAGASNPFRLDRTQAQTADQDHGYNPEEQAFDQGKMDLFPLSVGSADSAALAGKSGSAAIAQTTGLTMGYFDGNTVTGLWNYAQNYALNDNSFGSTFGPSTPGAINLVSGQTNGVVNDVNADSAITPDGGGGYTLISDADPTGDLCSTTTGETVHMTGKNIGDLLSSRGVTWGWFEGGFDLKKTNPNGSNGCARTTISPVTGLAEPDYIPHHEPFQYYASTQNLNHTRPSSVKMIGHDGDAANHQYDMHDFTDALDADNLPAVSFLKAPGYEDGHAGYSNPLDEQRFVVETVNRVEHSKYWDSTAIIINYDDSDGWYDHVYHVVNGSNSAADVQANGHTVCAAPFSTGSPSTALPGVDPETKHAQGRCGHGPRLPLLVISPWAKHNYIDNTATDQSSITRFIEDTFLESERIGQGSFDSEAGTLDNMFHFSQDFPLNAAPIHLNPTTGEVSKEDRW